MPTLEHRGLRFHFTDTADGAPGTAGAGAPVLALHSGGLSSRQWAKLAAQLAPRHRVLALDFSGCGASSPWPDGEPYHFSVEVEVVLRLLEGLEEPVHLVGHSLGGLVALHAGLRAPERVRSLCLHEPVTFSLLFERAGPESLGVRELELLRDVDQGGGDEPWLRRFIDWWQGTGAWDQLPEPARAQIRGVGRKLWLEVSSLLSDRTTAAQVGRFARPALVLCGEYSPAAERRTCELLARALPLGRLERLDGVGHLAPITHPALVNGRIAAFLAAS